MGLRNIITTRDKELFTKMTALHFTDEVMITKTKNNGINKILKSVNRNSKVLEQKDYGDKILLKRLSPLKINIRMRK